MNKTFFWGVTATFALLLGLGFRKSSFFRPALAQHLNAAAKATYVTAADVTATASRAQQRPGAAAGGGAHRPYCGFGSPTPVIGKRGA